MSPMRSLIPLLSELTYQAGGQFINRLRNMLRSRPHLAAWAIALLSIVVGLICQTYASVAGWSEGLYKLWSLSFLLFPFVYLAQGMLYLTSRRRLAHLSMATLLVLSVAVGVVFYRTPIATLGGSLPKPLDLLAWLFRYGGLAILLIGGWRVIWAFLWHAIGIHRPAGAFLVVLSGLALFETTARPVEPMTFYALILASLVLLGIGSWLAARPVLASSLSLEELAHRRFRVKASLVGTGVVIVLGWVALLPVFPIVMGIAEANFKSVYIQQVPDQNEGVYLITDQGVLQVYSWSIEPDTYPTDAAVLKTVNLHKIVVVQAAFDNPSKYQLVNLDNNQTIPWESFDQKGRELTFTFSQLPSGHYELSIPYDGMFGGTNYQFFTLK